MGMPYGAEAIEAAAGPAGWEIWPAPERYHEALYQSFPEFTCLCPRSSYPDFATVHLVTVPNRQVLELKHLKLWLNSFRNRTISHELATAEIVDTLADRLDPHYVFVLMEYTPRGNLITFPMIEHQHMRVGALAPDDPLQLALDNARHVKRLLIDRVLGRPRP
ncbi:MAG: preQ(1) synthase [Chloroflexota bacterium]|nr:preQ(1) synthase [Chloroflexota bacterium]